MRNTLLLRRAVDGSSVTRSAQSYRQIQQKKEIIVKTKQLLLIVILGALLLAACGGGGDSNAPTEVVKSVVDAMQTLDLEKASEYFCAEQKSQLNETLDTGFEDLEAMGMDPDELLEAFKLKMTDMKYEEKSKDGDKAVVHISGTMALEFDTDKLKSFFKQAAEAAGESVSDEELEFIVGIFEAMGGQEAPLDGDVALVKEDGKWLVCDELGFLDSSELFELPLP
jgi:hypothetical protein